MPAGRFRAYVRGVDQSGFAFLRAYSQTFLGQSVEVEALPYESDNEMIAGKRSAVRFKVTNRGADDSFKITTAEDNGFVSSVSDNEVTLASDTSELIDVKLDVPADTAAGSAIILTLVATSTTTSTVENSASFGWTIEPAECLVIINKNNEYTRSRKVTLEFTTSRDTTRGAKICLNSIGSSCKAWKRFVKSKKLKLSKGDGTKTVYVWIKDKLGVANETPCSNDIILDTKAPSKGTLSATAGDGQVILSWEGFEDENGIADYKLLYSKGTIPPNCSSGKILYSGIETSYIHTGLKNGKNYSYRVCATDKAGNTTKGATAKVKPNTIAISNGIQIQ